MGTDVWSESGVIVCLGDMYNSIPKRGFSVAIIAVQKYAKKKIAAAAKAADGENEKIDLLKCFLDVELNDRDGFIDALSSFSAYDDDDDFEYNSSGDIFTVWEIVLKATHPDLPMFGELKVFENRRECGYGVPIGEPVFIFDQTKLLKKVPTEKGKKFKKLFGSCDEISWSVMSY